MSTQFVHGSGNVFRDLGLSDPEERLAKADLAISIASAMATWGMTPAQACAIGGLTRDELDSVRLGRLDGFTQGRLRKVLESLTARA